MKNSLSLKKFLALFAALTVFCLSLCSCAPADDEDDETAEDVNYSGAVLNVYNWGVYMDDGKGEDGDGSYIDEETTMNVNAAFEQYYKETYGEEIKVQYTTYENNEAMYAKLSAGGANYDIVVPSDYMINRMIKEGMLEKLEFSNIPNYQNIDDQFKDGSWQYDPTGEYSVTYTWGTVGIVYDANVVTEEVSSFDILWDEKYAGKILMMNNPRDTFAVALAKNGKSLNSANADDWEQAYEDLERQKPLVQAYVTDECFEKMQNGEASLAPAYCGDFLIMEGDTAEGIDLRFAPLQNQNANKFCDAFCIPKGAKNKLAAERYIDFMCTYAPALANAHYTGYSSPNKLVQHSDEYYYKDDELVYPSEQLLDKYEEFRWLPEDIQSLMDERWNDLKKVEIGKGPYIAIAVVAVVLILAFVFRRVKTVRTQKLFEEFEQSKN